MISFFASPGKTRKDFLRSFSVIAKRLHIFWWKKKNYIGFAIFTLIIINGYYCAMSQNLILPPFLNRVNFFLNSILKMQLNSCFSTLSQILLKNSFGKVVFQIWSRDFFQETIICFFGRHFETKHVLIVLFSDIWLFWVYAHMVQVSYRTSYGKGSKWTPPPCAQMGVMLLLLTKLVAA